MSDAVDHPPHYARWKMEPIEFIAINNLPWWFANVLKYCARFDAKDGLKDLYKARSYLEMKIRQLEGEKKFWDKPVAEERKANKLDDVAEKALEYVKQKQAQEAVKPLKDITWNPGVAGYAHGPVGTIHHCDWCDLASSQPLPCMQAGVDHTSCPNAVRST